MSDYKPRSAFMPFHLRDKRWSCILAHRRAGKTVACVNEVLTRALASKKDRPQYAYISPYFIQSKQIAWEYFLSYGEKVIKRKNEAELWCELINGARIYLFGADNPDRLRGLYLDGVILDEPADMRPSFFSTVIRPALADRKGWCVWIGTPKGYNEFHDIYQEAQSNPEWYCLRLKASESGLLDGAELEDAKRVMSEDLYNQEFECSFDAAVQGAYYAKLITTAQDDGRICGVPYNPSSQVLTAWDLGFGDSTAIWFAQIVGKEIRIIDYYEASGVGIDHYVQLIKSKPYNYGHKWHFLPHDAGQGSLRTGTTLATQLDGMGVYNTVLKRGDIDAGIELVRQTIPQCWFDEEKTKDGVNALRNYQRKYDEKRGVFSPTPLHSWASHGADAFRYLAHALPLCNPRVGEPVSFKIPLTRSGYMGL